MLSPEWKLVQEKVNKARQREQITYDQAEFCLGSNTPKLAVQRLHGFQRLNAAPSAKDVAIAQLNQPQPIKPPVMSIDNLKFPAGIVFAAAIAVPTIEHAATGGFSGITYVVESICGLAVLGLVIVAAVNSATKK